VPTAAYGVPLLMAAIAYYILQQLIIASQGPASVLRAAVGGDWKGKVSPICYAVAIPLALKWPAAAWLIYAAVAVIWLVPDRRIEKMIGEK